MDFFSITERNNLEGPPLRVVAEELQKFEGALVIQVSGNSKIDKRLISNQKITKIFVVGKNLFLQFGKFTLRIHFLMFGSYRINEEKVGGSPRVSLVSSKGVLNFYNTAIRLLSIEEATALYDEEVDILSEKWKINKVIQLASQSPNSLICDVLLRPKCVCRRGQHNKKRSAIHEQDTPSKHYR